MQGDGTLPRGIQIIVPRLSAVMRQIDSRHRIGGPHAQDCPRRHGARGRSGRVGFRFRLAIGRGMMAKPALMLLDEPTSGLDPIGAGEFDDLIATLQKTLGLTVFMVTHDLDSLASICDRIAVLIEKKIKMGTLQEHLKDKHPWMQEYFHNKRAKFMEKA